MKLKLAVSACFFLATCLSYAVEHQKEGNFDNVLSKDWIITFYGNGNVEIYDDGRPCSLGVYDYDEGTVAHYEIDC